MENFEFTLTYPVRNLSFLQSVYISGIPNVTCSSMDKEEFEFMCIEACDMLMWQVKNCNEEDKWYFENLCKDYKDGKDIIEKHICKNHPEFLKFLKLIKAI